MADYDSEDSEDDGTLIMLSDINDDDEIPIEKVRSILQQADKCVRNVRKTLRTSVNKNQKTAAMVQDANKELTQQNRLMLKLREDNQDMRDLIKVTQGKLIGKAPPKDAAAMRTYAR